MEGLGRILGSHREGLGGGLEGPEGAWEDPEDFFGFLWKVLGGFRGSWVGFWVAPRDPGGVLGVPLLGDLGWIWEFLSVILWSLDGVWNPFGRFLGFMVNFGMS